MLKIDDLYNRLKPLIVTTYNAKDLQQACQDFNWTLVSVNWLQHMLRSYLESQADVCHATWFDLDRILIFAILHANNSEQRNELLQRVLMTHGYDPSILADLVEVIAQLDWNTHIGHSTLAYWIVGHSDLIKLLEKNQQWQAALRAADWNLGQYTHLPSTPLYSRVTLAAKLCYAAFPYQGTSFRFSPKLIALFKEKILALDWVVNTRMFQVDETPLLESLFSRSTFAYAYLDSPANLEKLVIYLKQLRSANLIISMAMHNHWGMALRQHVQLFIDFIDYAPKKMDWLIAALNNKLDLRIILDILSGSQNPALINVLQEVIATYNHFLPVANTPVESAKRALQPLITLYPECVALLPKASDILSRYAGIKIAIATEAPISMTASTPQTQHHCISLTSRPDKQRLSRTDVLQLIEKPNARIPAVLAESWQDSRWSIDSVKQRCLHRPLAQIVLVYCFALHSSQDVTTSLFCIKELSKIEWPAEQCDSILLSLLNKVAHLPRTYFNEGYQTIMKTCHFRMALFDRLGQTHPQHYYVGAILKVLDCANEFSVYEVDDALEYKLSQCDWNKETGHSVTIAYAILNLNLSSILLRNEFWQQQLLRSDWTLGHFIECKKERTHFGDPDCLVDSVAHAALAWPELQVNEKFGCQVLEKLGEVNWTFDLNLFHIKKENTLIHAIMKSNEFYQIMKLKNVQQRMMEIVRNSQGFNLIDHYAHSHKMSELLARYPKIMETYYQQQPLTACGYFSVFIDPERPFFMTTELYSLLFGAYADVRSFSEAQYNKYRQILIVIKQHCQALLLLRFALARHGLGDIILKNIAGRLLSNVLEIDCMPLQDCMPTILQRHESAVTEQRDTLPLAGYFHRFHRQHHDISIPTGLRHQRVALIHSSLRKCSLGLFAKLANYQETRKEMILKMNACSADLTGAELQKVFYK